MICLHGVGVGSINFSVLLTDNHRSSIFVDALLFPNASWLRSFRQPWGLGGKIGRMEHDVHSNPKQKCHIGC